MKNYNITINGALVNFAVDEDWLDGLKVKATGSFEQQIYTAAMSNPKMSGITTNDNAINASIEDVKKLVEKAAGINEAKHGDIEIAMDAPGKYTVKFAEHQTYAMGLTLNEADRAIDKLSAYLDHNNVVQVRTFDYEGKTDLQRNFDMEEFIAQKVCKVVGSFAEGDKVTLIFVPKGWRYMNEE